MVWSFVKIAIFISVVALLALGAGHLADTGSGVRITLANMEFSFGPVQMVIGAAIALLLLWLALKILGLIVATIRFINGDETAISRYFDRNRERKGYQALADGMVALASGEARAAMSQAAKAERYLQKPELTNLLTAQAAELGGDTKRATEVYKRLLTDDRTRFVGVRGLMKQKLSEGDTATAMKLAEKAYAIKPRNAEIQDTLLKLQADHGDWKGAREVLGAKAKQGLLPRDVYRRRDAVLALQEAKGIIAEDATIEAREAAIAANRQSPDLIPAAVLAAQSYVDMGKPAYAARVLKKAWGTQPHPDLAAAFAAIEPNETPAERQKRFAPILKLHPEAEETRLLSAELNIAAEDFPAARRALGNLPETHPTARSLTLMAAIARGEGEDEAIVRGWLTRALTASRGPRWICDNCQHVQGEWAPTCDSCHGFDTLSWREATDAPVSLPHSAEMLPLIVGTPDEPEEPTVDPDEDPDTALDESVIVSEETGRAAQN